MHRCLYHNTSLSPESVVLLPLSDLERERERENRSCLFKRETGKEETQAANMKEDLPASADGGGSGHGFSLKGTEHIITFPSLFYNKKTGG